ncbi:MAG: beta-galactosidase [Phycisphaerae bacterium]|nr:beta-galactosidase [Phycisphaerae bacterium]
MRHLIPALALVLMVSAEAHSQWKPAGERLKTSWAEKVDPENAWDAYPRPLLRREQWRNLNGLWDYAIRLRFSPPPAAYDGTILVPFPVESSLSGVMKTVGEDNVVWYERRFTVPPEWGDRDILLHFGAVDWKADVWLNDIKIGSHTGGYTPFHFNITPYLNRTGDQKLAVRVWDPTDQSYQPRGKQVSKPHGIWYTAVTGIWQTVWIEPVSRGHLIGIKTTPDIDKQQVRVEVSTHQAIPGDYAEVRITADGEAVAVARAVITEAMDIHLESPRLWSPESPFLYDLEVTLYSGGDAIDRAKSYFAMRKFSTARDEYGIVRLQLNNEDYFPMGTLDQGWWPDGLYTAPSDDALLYDIRAVRDLGFNLIRKHVKVEPARWYMHCDREGLLVWQDMPSGDQTPVWQMRQYFDGVELQRSQESEANFRKEWKAIIDLLYSHPSVVTWIPFNEAWGQFKTEEIAEWTKRYDPSRLVIPASGGNHFQTGDMLAIHHYPAPSLYLYDAARPTVLNEFGGIGLALKGHLWEPDRNWGYIQFNSEKEVTDQYAQYAGELMKLIKAGISGAVYTQITDVEIEVNGLLTYDREKFKVDVDRIRQANHTIRGSLAK